MTKVSQSICSELDSIHCFGISTWVFTESFSDAFAYALKNSKTAQNYFVIVAPPCLIRAGSG